VPFDGSGVFAYTSTSIAPDAVTGTTISSTDQDTFSADIATALTLCLTKNGESTPSDNIKMGSKKLTALAAGSAVGDSVRYEQVCRLVDAQTVAGAKTFSSNPLSSAAQGAGATTLTRRSFVEAIASAVSTPASAAASAAFRSESSNRASSCPFLTV
jgi:hypothetical protein